MLLALDDTDGPDGGCTTHVASLIAAELGEQALSGPMRLVRLFPANPWKTRGNAAVVLEIDDGLDADRVLSTALNVVRARAEVAPGKGAGLALFAEPPDESWYWRGVQGMVELDEVRAAVGDVPTAALGTGRGLVGALCAAAWRPRSPTWELIAYREPAWWGKPRVVDPVSLAEVEAAYTETFDCMDPQSGRPVMVPHTPCPVLYGLRATRPERLAEASLQIRSEPVERTTLFVANHASDDHVTDDSLEHLTVSEPPRTLKGGHVVLSGTTEAGGERTCLAFEPTGSLRLAVARMKPGDRVLPVGGAHGESINLEKILHAPGPRRAGKTCPGCGASMKSTGRSGGLRCRRCGTKVAAELSRDAPVWYEADPKARRHLARPLKLGLAARVEKAADALADPPANA